MKLVALVQALPLHLMADPEFAALPAVHRTEVVRVMDAVRDAARECTTVTAAVNRFGAMLGLPAGTARRRWDAVRKHGWQGALDGRRKRQSRADVSRRPQFLAYWQNLCEKHQRSCRSAWHDLITLWKSGTSVPGYEEHYGRPPVNRATGLPFGWHYGNLVRYAPDEKERLLARIGPKAYTGKTTSLWTTRVGLHVGEVYQFDDVWHDHQVFFGRQLVRPLELGCVDVFSTRRCMYGLCPRVREGDAHRGLREDYMLWLTVGLLTSVGYHQDGCTLIVEHGTAALSEDMERRLFDASAGKIRVDRSGIADKPAVLGWWAGEGGGNPRMKACLESLHNYYHNRLGLIPAQTGGNARVDKPEQLAAVEKYSTQLARELGHFGADQVDALMGLLRLPALTLAQFHGLLDQFYTVIDSRILHALEGWDRAGLIRAQWRLSENSADWHDAGELATMGEQEYAVVKQLTDGNPTLVRQQRLSPLQVWEQGRARLRRLAPWCVHQVLPETLAREVIVRDHRIEFADREIDPDSLRYETVVTDVQGRRVILPEREKFAAYINPLSPGLAHLVDSSGRYVGTSLRVSRAPRADREAIFRAIGAEAHRQNERMREYRERNAGEADDHQAMLDHNKQVLEIAAALAQGRDMERRAAPLLPDPDEDVLAAVGEDRRQATADSRLETAGVDRAGLEELM